MALSELSADDEATDTGNARSRLTHAAGDGGIKDASQYPSDDSNSPSQYPLSDSDPSKASVLQYVNTSSLSQYPLTDSRSSDKSRGSLSQYPILEEDLSKGTEQKSKSDSSDIAMFQTRPGTVIERPETDGHNDQDDVAPPIKNPPVVSITKATPDISAKPVLDMTKSTFDTSIRVQHVTQSTIGGDSTMHDDRTPLTSSTPNWVEHSKISQKGDGMGDQGGEKFMPLKEDLLGSYGPSDKSPEMNWSLNKVPTAEYVPENDRARLLGTSYSIHKHEDSKPTESMKTRSMDFDTMFSVKSDAQQTAHDADFAPLPHSTTRSSGSLEQFTVDPSSSVDTSVWSSTRTSMEKDGEVEQRISSPPKPAKSPTSEGLELMRGPSPKEMLQQIAANSPVLTPGLSLARENASLDLFNKKGPGSTGSSDGAQQRSGTDSMLQYDARERHSHASDDSEDRRSIGSADSCSRSSKNSQERPQTVGRGSNDFQPLVPVDSTFEVSALSIRESLESVDKASRASSNISSYHTVPSTMSADKIDKMDVVSHCSKSDHSVGSAPMEDKTLCSESKSRNSNVTSSSASKETVAQIQAKDLIHEDLSLPVIPSGTTIDFEPSQPNSARSSQDSKRSSLSIGATAESLNRRGSLSDRVAQILADKTTPTGGSTPKEGSGGSQQATADVVDDVADDVDSDVERITGEYKAILQGVSAKLAAGETDNIQKMADDALRTVSQSEIVIETTTETPEAPKDKENPTKPPISYKYVPQMTTIEASSGSDTEDALDRDVKRILAKYGRHLSSDEETDKPKPEFKPPSQVPSEGRSSPAGSAYSTDDTLSHRVQNLLLKSADMGSTASPTTLPGYMYDDPARSMTLPMELRSNSSTSEPTEALAEAPGEVPDRAEAPDRSEMPDRPDVPEPNDVGFQKPVDVEIHKPREFLQTTEQDSASVDTLHEKVSEILSNSGHFIGSDASSHVSSSRSPSRTSSVDYKLLQQDLIELESNLEHMKTANSRQEEKQTPKNAGC